jgi:hypothetical protein
VHSAEVDRVDKLEGLLGDGDFSEVLVLQVGVDLGLLGVLVVLEFELGDEGLSVLIALGEEGGEVIDFL